MNDLTDHVLLADAIGDVAVNVLDALAGDAEVRRVVLEKLPAPR
jgi:hypothetical protein